MILNIIILSAIIVFLYEGAMAIINAEIIDDDEMKL